MTLNVPLNVALTWLLRLQVQRYEPISAFSLSSLRPLRTRAKDALTRCSFCRFGKAPHPRKTRPLFRDWRLQAGSRSPSKIPCEVSPDSGRQCEPRPRKCPRLPIHACASTALICHPTEIPCPLESIQDGALAPQDHERTACLAMAGVEPVDARRHPDQSMRPIPNLVMSLMIPLSMFATLQNFAPLVKPFLKIQGSDPDPGPPKRLCRPTRSARVCDQLLKTDRTPVPRRPGKTAPVPVGRSVFEELHSTVTIFRGGVSSGHIISAPPSRVKPAVRLRRRLCAEIDFGFRFDGTEYKGSSDCPCRIRPLPRQRGVCDRPPRCGDLPRDILPGRSQTISVAFSFGAKKTTATLPAAGGSKQPSPT